MTKNVPPPPPPPIGAHNVPESWYCECDRGMAGLNNANLKIEHLAYIVRKYTQKQTTFSNYTNDAACTKSGLLPQEKVYIKAKGTHLHGSTHLQVDTVSVTVSISNKLGTEMGEGAVGLHCSYLEVRWPRCGCVQYRYTEQCPWNFEKYPFELE